MERARRIQPILNALPVFEAAARTSNFTKAAEALGMAQPSVSRFVAILEDHLGVRLFLRSGNQILLTKEGQKLHEATVLALGHIRLVVDELSSTGGRDVITLGCTHGFAHMWVLPRIVELESRLLDKEIQLMTADHTVPFSVDSTDLVINFGDGNWPDRDALFLFEEEVFPVCSPEFAEWHRLTDLPLVPAVLLDLPLLIQDKGEYGWVSWSSWFEHHGLAFSMPPQSQSINNYAFVLQAAMEGKGIALAWENLTEPYLRNNWLIELKDMRLKTGKGYYLTHSHRHPSTKAAEEWVAEVNSNRLPRGCA